MKLIQSKNIFVIALLTMFVLSYTAALVSAQNDIGDEESGNYEIYGLELEKLAAMINAWLATFLFVTAFIAYKRDERKRLFFVSLAFLLFAIKSFLISSELIFPEVEWFDPLSKFLEFGVLLSFFYGALKK